MEKIILVDGNNLLYRSYYATAYNGNLMKNSKDFPTNGLYGFVNMINKILRDYKPTHILVAFDKGKTFRHKKYSFYKEGRKETPKELIMQFPIAKEILKAMGIKHLEVDNYEADDIIGTFAKIIEGDKNFDGTIISSDKDLLQLISDNVDVKLLKSKDFKIMNNETFFTEYGIDPIRIIDLKSLSGDASDNIPGVKGVGDKTALKLLHEYGTLQGVYDNIDNIKGKLQERLISDKENAFISYEMATIYKEVPMGIGIDDIINDEINNNELINIYNELEFYSFTKNMDRDMDSDIECTVIKSVDEIHIEASCAVYLELEGTNYHKEKIVGMGVYNDEVSYYIPYDVLKNNPKFLYETIKYTYDIKKVITALRWNDIATDKFVEDVMISGYLLNYNVKDDIAMLANNLGYNIPFIKKEELSLEEISKRCVLKAKFIYETIPVFKDKMEKEFALDLYKNIEVPLAKVLSDMEFTGVNVDKDFLNAMGEDINVELESLTNSIYSMAGVEFNIGSPKQLGDILFDKLELPHGKKIKTGYSTNRDVLNKLIGVHPIIDKVIEYRTLSKLHSTYIEGLKETIMSDGKIHTIYNQTLTRTGRLSSVEPNLQNIPIRYEYGRLIRKAFKSSVKSIIMASDYSQIELRILAHVSKADNLVSAFINGLDIHTKTASDIFGIPIDEVTSKMRSRAKAVNFGIVYGISSFGLSEDTGISIKEAQAFIDKYLETFPGVKNYMDNIIKEAYEQGYVKTLMNRKRVIDELNNKNYMIKKQGERIALNTPIQGTSADILKKAMIEIYEEFKNRKIKSKMILQVHDELVFDVLLEEKQQVREIVKTIMENTYRLDVPLKVDMNFGNDWYDAK